MHRTFSFFVVLLGLAMLLAFLCVGLNMAERGTQELVGLSEPRRSLSFMHEEKGLIITFAGRDYSLPWKYFGRKMLDIFFEQVADLYNKQG